MMVEPSPSTTLEVFLRAIISSCTPHPAEGAYNCVSLRLGPKTESTRCRWVTVFKYDFCDKRIPWNSTVPTILNYF